MTDSIPFIVSALCAFGLSAGMANAKQTPAGLPLSVSKTYQYKCEDVSVRIDLEFVRADSKVNADSKIKAARIDVTHHKTGKIKTIDGDVLKYFEHFGDDEQAFVTCQGTFVSIKLPENAGQAMPWQFWMINVRPDLTVKYLKSK